MFLDDEDAPPYRARAQIRDPNRRVYLEECVFMRSEDLAWTNRFREYVFAVSNDPSWVHEVPTNLGQIIDERWALQPVGTGAAEGHHHTGEALYYQLLLVHRGLNNIVGLSIDCTREPPGDGWGATLGYAVRGEGILGSRLELNFTRWVDGQVVDVVPLLPTMWTLPDNFCACEPDTTPRVHRERAYYHWLVLPEEGDERLDLLLSQIASGPEMMRQVGISQYRGLLKRVHDEIAEGKLSRVEFGPPPADGTPPRTTTHDIWFWVRRRIRNQATSEIESRIAQLEADAEAMFEALSDLIPLPELFGPNRPR